MPTRKQERIHHNTIQPNKYRNKRYSGKSLGTANDKWDDVFKLLDKTEAFVDDSEVEMEQGNEV